jgi:phage terminase large subunit
MKQNEGIMSGECYVVCDSAEPRSINRLVSAGIPAIKADKKGGSVMSGIRKVQSMNLHIHEDSHDLQNEANNYKFKIDSRSDTVLEIPVKEHDDGMDAGRYPTDMFAE